MISRRTLFSQLALIAAAGGAWILRDQWLWPSPKVEFADGASSGWLPMLRPEQQVVIVETRLGGVVLPALIDSGAQSSVIDRATADRLGIEPAAIAPVVLAYGVSGAPKVGRAATFDLQIGGLTLKGVRAATLDLAAISGASGRDFALILGQDVLRTVIADLDFPAGRLSFHAPAAYRPPPGATAAPARLHRRELQAAVAVDSRSLQATVDTGSSAIVALSEETAERAGLLAGRAIGSAPSIGFGGLSRDRVFTADKVEFAGRAFTGVPVHVYRPSAGRIPDGLLGAGALSAFRVVLDLGRGRLLLVEPASKSGQSRGRRNRA